MHKNQTLHRLYHHNDKTMQEVNQRRHQPYINQIYLLHHIIQLQQTKMLVQLSFYPNLDQQYLYQGEAICFVDHQGRSSRILCLQPIQERDASSMPLTCFVSLQSHPALCNYCHRSPPSPPPSMVVAQERTWLLLYLQWSTLFCSA